MKPGQQSSGRCARSSGGPSQQSCDPHTAVVALLVHHKWPAGVSTCLVPGQVCVLLPARTPINSRSETGVVFSDGPRVPAQSTLSEPCHPNWGASGQRLLPTGWLHGAAAAAAAVYHTASLRDTLYFPTVEHHPLKATPPSTFPSSVAQSMSSIWQSLCRWGEAGACATSCAPTSPGRRVSATATSTCRSWQRGSATP